MDFGYLKQIVFTCIVFLNYFLIGISRGFPSLLSKHSAENGEDLIQEEDIWLIAGICVFPNPVGSLIAGFLMDYFGRINTLKISTILFSISWLVIANAPKMLYLYAAFFVIGISVGMALVSAVYVAEISLDRRRSVLLSTFIVFFSSGVMVSYIVTYFLHWQKSAWVFAALSALTLALFFLVDESPLWYMRQGRKDEAIRALRSTRHLSAAEAEKEYESALQDMRHSSRKTTKDTLTRHLVRSVKPFCVLMLFQICLQGSGYSLLLAYSQRIFQNIALPIGKDEMALTYSVAVFASSFCAPFAALFGSRKWLVAVSSSGMTTTLLTILLAIHLEYARLVQCCLYVYVFFCTFGCVMVSECMPSELFRMEVRGFMCGLTQAFTTVMQGTLIMVFPALLDATGVSLVMYAFAAFSAALLLFGVYVLPETKDKTLQQIQDEYFSDEPKHAAAGCADIL